ncbi:MAG: hypothetical protein KDA20_09370 [Phycisphaerales bacterium]|nr:hypothetical protein [Phycisphaerales bacterium]
MFGELILAASMSISPASASSYAGDLAAFAGTAQTSPFALGSIDDGNRGNRNQGNRWNGGDRRGQTPKAQPQRSSNRSKQVNKSNQKQVNKSRNVDKQVNRNVNRSRDVNRSVTKNINKDINKDINKTKVINKNINKTVYKTKDRDRNRHHYSSYYYNNHYRNWRGYNWSSWWNDWCDDDFNFSINLNYDLTPYRSTSYYSYSRPVVEYYPAPSTNYTSVYVTPGSAYDTSSYVYAAPSSDTDYRLYQQLLDEQRRLQDRVDELEQDAPVNFVPIAPDYTTPVPQSDLNPSVKPDRPGPIVIEGDILEPAWRTLASGDATVAQRMFAMQAQSDEATAMDRVGFALAAADLGDIRAAAWSMRRALDENANAIGFMPSDGALQSKLGALAGKLVEQHAKALSPEHAIDISTVAAVVSALRLDDQAVKRWASAAAEARADASLVEQLNRLAGE